MAGVCVAGDSAGGPLIAGGNSKLKIKGKLAIVVGDKVTPHGSSAPHNAAPMMVAGSGKFKIGGKAICRAGDAASCGHSASASDFFSAG